MKLVGGRTIEEARVQEISKEVASGTMTKGAGIRECFAGGMDVKEISKGLDIKYNHVYNVVKNEVIVNGLEVENTGRNSENSKKNQILKLLQEGKTITEVATELKCLYNYVWQVAKGAGLTGKKQEQEVIEVIVPDDLVPQKTTSKKSNKKEVKTA